MKLHNHNLREFIAEGLGTFTLVALGCAANANAKLANLAGGMAGIAWGMALTAGIFVCGGVSGGHINPAVTLGMASIGKLPWYKVPHYLISQFIGAFLGALVVFLVYSNAIFTKFTGYLVMGENATADIFGTYPSPDATIAIAFFEQVVACFFFLMLINAITDRRNMNCPKGVVPIAIGITDLGLCLLTYSYNSGGPINPARDFSPRLLSAIVGYGSETFTAGNAYFWVPLVACPLGGILGSLAYKYLIEKHWPTDLDTTGTDPSSNEPNIFKQANKLYSSAKLTENEAKTNCQLLISLMSNVKADDLGYNQADVDKKILVSAPTAYSKLYENDFFNLSLFSIGPNSRLPLHNHPGMDGFLKVVSGKILIKTFDQLPQDIDKPPSNILSSIPYRMKSSSIVPTRRLEDKIISVDDQFVALIKPEKGNIHEITVSPDCKTGSAFLDLIAPPYDRDSSDRSVSYYHILGNSYSSKLSADITWLLEIPPPEDYWCAFLDYLGPELSDKILKED